MIIWNFQFFDLKFIKNFMNWIFRAPPHHTLPAFRNLNGIKSEKTNSQFLILSNTPRISKSLKNCQGNKFYLFFDVIGK